MRGGDIPLSALGSISNVEFGASHWQTALSHLREILPSLSSYLDENSIQSLSEAEADPNLRVIFRKVDEALLFLYSVERIQLLTDFIQSMDDKTKSKSLAGEMIIKIDEDDEKSFGRTRAEKRMVKNRRQHFIEAAHNKLISLYQQIGNFAQEIFFDEIDHIRAEQSQEKQHIFKTYIVRRLLQEETTNNAKRESRSDLLLEIDLETARLSDSLEVGKQRFLGRYRGKCLLMFSLVLAAGMVIAGMVLLLARRDNKSERVVGFVFLGLGLAGLSLGGCRLFRLRRMAYRGRHSTHLSIWSPQSWWEDNRRDAQQGANSGELSNPLLPNALQ